MSQYGLSERDSKRWMRPDAHRFLRSNWRRFWKPGQEDHPLYKFYDGIERKYRPDQLRDDLGRWTDEGDGSQPGDTKPRQWISGSTAESCLAQYRKDVFVCAAFTSPACYAQAMLRYSNCLAG